MRNMSAVWPPRAVPSLFFFAAALSVLAVGCARPGHKPADVPAVPVSAALPDKDFTHKALLPHDPSASYFTFDQLDSYYRVPGEFTHRLNGDEYGFEALSFIISETHPGGGPGLHVHDVEEAHVLLEGTVQYRIGEKTFIVHGPYVARVPAGVPHTFVNVGTRPFNLVAVFSSKHPSSRRIGPNPLIPLLPSRQEPPTGFQP